MLQYFYITILFLVFFVFTAKAQKDSSHKKTPVTIAFASDSNTAFTGTRIVDKEDTNSFHKIELSAYVSSYYAHYSDETAINGFSQFPTMAPRNNQFGLNIAQIGLEFHTKRMRSNVVLHYGDIPETNWPKPFTLIQEAHGGVLLVKNLWLDVGFFKTHIGLESIQPRENITSSMSVVNYYEPYFFSGAKLTYQVSSKLSLQINAFNGYNEYIDNNKNKAIGFSALYDVNEHISLTYNLLTCDETPDVNPTKHFRAYNNLYGTYKKGRWNIGFEANYGFQKNSLLTDTTKTANLFSGLIVGKYQLVKKIGIYARGEYFSDKNNILTNTLNTNNYVMGSTFGVEFKPVKNVAISGEYRLLQVDNTIFKERNAMTNQRNEFIFCMDVWF